MATKDNKKPLKVVELFAGVGGFHLGLAGKSGTKKNDYEVVWFNQWEPSTVRQHAHDVYVAKFPAPKESGHTNTDIAEVVRLARAGEFQFPDHDVLVGGFPCQDYSVARNLSSSAGLEGKKGVLWWSIHEILNIKGAKAPNYLMLENVDRLLVSPASRRGKDFAIILSSLIKLGYVVEWRVINAAEYGFPQRRKRTFILGYKKGSPVEKKFRKLNDPEKWLVKDGLVQQSFPAVLDGPVKTFNIDSDPVVVSKEFNLEKQRISPFANAGVMVDGKVYTARVTADYKGKFTTLGEVLLPESEVPKEYYIDKEDLPRWVYLKGAKNEPRKGSDGYEFTYKEGSMSFPDSPTKASRTIITAEGGKTPSRFKHVVKTKKGYRRLTPIELERLCMFPDKHTEGHADARRAFFMGNALVVGVIDGLGKALTKLHYKN